MAQAGTVEALLCAGLVFVGAAPGTPPAHAAGAGVEQPLAAFENEALRDEIETWLEREPEVAQRCARDIVASAIAQAGALRGEPPSAAVFDVQSLPDLDGDGRDELMLVDAYNGTANNPHFIFVSDGPCPNPKGHVWAHAEGVKPTAGRANGLSRLRVQLSSGRADGRLEGRTLRWSGRAWVTAN